MIGFGKPVDPDECKIMAGSSPAGVVFLSGYGPPSRTSFLLSDWVPKTAGKEPWMRSIEEGVRTQVSCGRKGEKDQSRLKRTKKRLGTYVESVADVSIAAIASGGGWRIWEIM